MNYEGFEFEQTCGACPEQYDVTLNGKRMAYLRLRHGYFYAAVPDCGGQMVYSAEPKGDGIFECDEREKYLKEALAAIIQHYYQEGIIAKAICLNCKTIRWAFPKNLLLTCRECAPYNSRFHEIIPNYNYNEPMIQNSLFCLEPTRNNFGVWSFNDILTNLRNEPFVGETNDLIDAMVLESGRTLERASKGIALIFSAGPFPGAQCALTLEETCPSGTTYICDKFKLKPWLCPAFFKYFPTAPERLYAMVKNL